MIPGSMPPCVHQRSIDEIILCDRHISVFNCHAKTEISRLDILELEKEHVSKTVGPQIAKDVDDVSKVIQEALDKLKKFMSKS